MKVWEGFCVGKQRNALVIVVEAAVPKSRSGMYLTTEFRSRSASRRSGWEDVRIAPILAFCGRETLRHDGRREPGIEQGKPLDFLACDRRGGISCHRHPAPSAAAGPTIRVQPDNDLQDIPLSICLSGFSPGQHVMVTAEMVARDDRAASLSTQIRKREVRVHNGHPFDDDIPPCGGPGRIVPAQRFAENRNSFPNNYDTVWVADSVDWLRRARR